MGDSISVVCVFCVVLVGGRGTYFLTEKFLGFLDRLRENLEILDSTIAHARKMSEEAENTKAIQWTKTLRDLIELRNATLEKVKAHLLGKDETGSTVEPVGHYSGHPEVMFEREFQRFLAPWHESNLNLKCKDCGVENQEVKTRQLTRTGTNEFGLELPMAYDVDLCEKCCTKRDAKSTEE